MTNISKTLRVPFTAQQMYALINDIEAYPDFLPWCKAATVHHKSDVDLKATLCLSKGPLSHSITTQNTMQPHSQINMMYSAGPFKNCAGSWRFVPVQQNEQCDIIFNFEYEFANRLTAFAIEPIFFPISNTLIDAFYQRAIQIYGK
jgi:ribosome-associated toxin RatA of RatAB toxin-antitoxin module